MHRRPRRAIVVATMVSESASANTLRCAARPTGQRNTEIADVVTTSGLRSRPDTLLRRENAISQRDLRLVPNSILLPILAALLLASRSKSGGTNNTFRNVIWRERRPGPLWVAMLDCRRVFL